MTLTEEQCRRLVELLEERMKGLTLWPDFDHKSRKIYRVRYTLKTDNRVRAASGPTPSAALLAALEKVSK